MTEIGVAVALTAAVANALAVVLQAAEARSTPTEEGMHASLLVDLAHRRRWLAGTVLIVLGGILQVVALALAPIALVQPTLATDMLLLLVVARFKLGEPVGRMEAIGAAALLAGLVAVLVASPAHSISPKRATDLGPAVGTVAGLVLATFVAGRWRHAGGLWLVLGAGLSYSWTDFASKLFAGEISDNDWLPALAWLAGMLGVGALAFLQENSALQVRPAVTVAPVIDAVKVPLPVLMAFWAGAEAWGSNVSHIAVLLVGLAAVAAGAATLGRSETVARLSAGESTRPRRPRSAVSRRRGRG